MIFLNPAKAMSDIQVQPQESAQSMWESRGWVFIDPPFLTFEEALDTISPREREKN